MKQIKLLFSLIAVSISSILISKGQDQFTLMINTRNENIKSMKILTAMDSSYYKTNLSYSTKVGQDSFIYQGNLPYPYLCELLVNEETYSDKFMIYPGTNKLRLTKTGETIRLLRDDQHNDEYKFAALAAETPNYYDIYKYLASDHSNNIITDKSSQAVKKLLDLSYAKTDSNLYRFTELYPDSYFGLWYIARLIPFGYNTIHGDSFYNLSEHIRNSYLGIWIGNRIRKHQSLAKGGTIPDTHFYNFGNQKLRINDLLQGKKYTLITFWYSNCGPCIAKFPELIQLNDKYKDLFQVIAVSTDKPEEKDNLTKVVQKHGLPWLNLIDQEGASEDVFLINVYPYGYLVDSTGNILENNPSMLSLSTFLEQQNHASKEMF